MARKPSIRPNYQLDATYLINLSRAIEMDPKRSDEWKKKAMSKLQELVTMFMADAAELNKTVAG